MQFDKSEIGPEFQELVNEFPEIFLEPSDTVKSLDWRSNEPEDLCNLRYGFEHGAGWIGILREFCTKARALVERERAAGDTQAGVYSFIVKEKFGELRWQGDQRFERKEAREEFYALVEELQHKSSTTCEATGVEGRLRTSRGWVKTLCDEEAKKRGYTD